MTNIASAVIEEEPDVVLLTHMTDGSTLIRTFTGETAQSWALSQFVDGTIPRPHLSLIGAGWTEAQSMVVVDKRGLLAEWDDSY